MKVELKNVTKRFPNRNKKAEDIVAVGNFNYEFPDGKLIGLLGPSGCGKSTMLYMISGLETPTEGQIFFGENDVTKISPENRGIGLVFQNYALYPHLTVRQNIMFPLENLKGKDKLTREEINKKTEEAAALVQLVDYLERKPGELSGGQQQRVAIARALVKTPNVLLLDEPLSNLDARLRLQTREEISRIQKETGVTTIFVTHDQEEAMSISDEIVLMKNGVFQQAGKPQSVYDDPKNLFVAKFLGTPAINVFAGKIENGGLYIGNEKIFSLEPHPSKPDGFDTFSVGKAGDCASRAVYVGIRPEGFIVDENGPLHCEFIKKEVMGRDISIVSKNSFNTGATVRSIISAETVVPEGDTIAFSLKPSKVHVFDAETEERIYLNII